jgi:Ca-activated chloride channel family protein
VSLEFNNPHALWLALLIPVYLYVTRRRISTCAVRYPSVRNLKTLPRSLRQRCRYILPALRALALLLLIVVLARPLRRVETQELPSEGIGIAMVVDRSGSMGYPDNKLRYNGGLKLRFDVAKDALELFVEGNGKDLKGRPNDLIGLLTFATYPETDHPFSLDHVSLVRAMEKMSAEKPFLDQYGKPTDDPREAAQMTDERGRKLYYPNGQPAPRPNPMQMTSLKTAIEYAARKLILLGEDLKRPSNLQTYALKNKVMVLLTDGEPTAADATRGGDFPDEETIKMLTDAGIRVYFIQILARERYRERPDGTVEVITPQQAGFFGQMQAQQEAEMANKAIEEARKLARRTGGEHFLATTGDQIKDIYAKIDKLERSDVGGRTVFSHAECYRPYLMAALGMLAVELVLGATWLRRAP